MKEERIHVHNLNILSALVVHTITSRKCDLLSVSNLSIRRHVKSQRVLQQLHREGDRHSGQFLFDQAEHRGSAILHELIGRRLLEQHAEAESPRVHRLALAAPRSIQSRGS